MWNSLVFLWIICNTFNTHSGFGVDDILETELDPRSPSDFSYVDLLTVRMKGFAEMERFENDKSIKWKVNWEKFATSYWYETRVANGSCPMVPEGIAAKCDLVLTVPCLFGDISQPPRTIFVHSYMLPHFAESTLRFLNREWSFVLVSGGTDATVPRQVDSRYKTLRGFGLGGTNFERIINSPQIIHWFAENKDMNHPKMSALPTGMATIEDKDKDYKEDFPENYIPLKDRHLLVMLSDRVRTGTGQWADRAHAVDLCRKSPLCMQPFGGDAALFNGVSHKEFLRHLSEVPFVACVHGGGVDPSPKAWESILIGTIPIIVHSTVDDAYNQLPVAYIDKWEDVFESPTGEEMLRHWIELLAPYYEPNSQLRNETLKKLTTQYWFDQIQLKIDEFDNQEE